MNKKKTIPAEGQKPLLTDLELNKIPQNSNNSELEQELPDARFEFDHRKRRRTLLQEERFLARISRERD